MVSTSEQIAQFVEKRCMDLYHSHSKAGLAILRRGIGKKIGDRPDILEYVILPEYVEDSRGAAQRAVYTALTLYALHQQGRAECMCRIKSEEEPKSGRTFGAALRLLTIRKPQEKTAVIRRFNQVLTAKDAAELSIHARGLITQLRGEGIPVDYGQFTKDLFWFQIPEYRRKVVLAWGKEFYREIKEEQ